MALLANRTGRGRMGLSVLLKYFQINGRFPPHHRDVPGPVLAFLGEQVSASPAGWFEYDLGGRGAKRDRERIRSYLVSRRRCDALDPLGMGQGRLLLSPPDAPAHTRSHRRPAVAHRATRAQPGGLLLRRPRPTRLSRLAARGACARALPPARLGAHAQPRSPVAYAGADRACAAGGDVRRPARRDVHQPHLWAHRHPVGRPLHVTVRKHPRSDPQTSRFPSQIS